MAGKYFYFKPKYINGELAPDFETMLITGEDFQLSDLRGNYILLDFWGSWCGPCRQENPQVVRLHDKYNKTRFKDADGFKVVSVAIETNEKRWKSAIEKDRLMWKHHIGEFERFKSEIASKYGVKESPTKYLISPDGYIVGVNQPISEIDSFLGKRVKS